MIRWLTLFQVPVKKLPQPFLILAARCGKRAAVLRSVNDPELLRLLCRRIQLPAVVRGNKIVPFPGDDQDRRRRYCRDNLDGCNGIDPRPEGEFIPENRKMKKRK